MKVRVQVISQRPPGGRCNLYTGYAEAIARQFGTKAEIVYSETRSAHGEGFPSLWVNGVALQPEDGLILMPADIEAALAGMGIAGKEVQGLTEALDAPLEHMMAQVQDQGNK